MITTKEGTYDSVLLSEETMMNGEYSKVHPDLLKTQPEPPKGFCSSKISWPTILNVMVLITVIVDAQLRLGLLSFGILLGFVPMFLSIVKVLALQPKKVPPTMDGERIFGEIIHLFWVPAGEQTKIALCYFIVQYTFEGVTYQRKYLDHTWGLLATETYIELIVNKSTPKEPMAAFSLDSLNRHHQDTGTTTGFLEDCFSWFVTIILFMFVALPLFAIPVDCNTFDLDCTPTVWMDAILHYVLILGFDSLFSYSAQDKMKKCQAALAMDRVEKPFVPLEGDRVVDHSLYDIILRSSCSRLYLATGSVSFIIWMLYASFESGISFVYYLYLAALTVWMGYTVAEIIMDNIHLEPVRAKYQREGILPKSITVLKSGGHATNLTSIIKYDIDITNSNGSSKTVTAYARIKTGDEHKLLILPSEPTTAFVPEAPPPKSWQTIAKLVASPLGVISFYTWKENTGVMEKCVFAAITCTLCVISSVCFAMVTVSGVHNPPAGKRGNTVVSLKS